MPFLWFNDDAKEAVQFYVSLFKNSTVGKTTLYDEAGAKASGRKAGSLMTVAFTLAGQDFAAINGGPAFAHTPAISLYVTCDSEEEIDRLYSELSKESKVMMPLQAYPFSKKYVWLQDRFGLSWQLNWTEPLPSKISPCLMFVGNMHGKAEEAMDYYTSVFKNSRVVLKARYEEGEGEVAVGTIKHELFLLEGQSFIAMDSSLDHQFNFNEAFCLVVNCSDQKELDYFWEKLTDGGQEVQCGWLKDRYGIAWQVWPLHLPELLSGPNGSKVFKAVLGMKKLNVEELERAAEQ